jgi:hypothetical protein
LAGYVSERKVALTYNVLTVKELRRDRRGKQEIPCVHVVGTNSFLYNLEKLAEYLRGKGYYRVAHLNQKPDKPYVYNREKALAAIKAVELRLLRRAPIEQPADRLATQILVPDQNSDPNVEKAALRAST